MLSLSDEVRYVKGVGPKLAEKLAKLDVKTINDLLFYFPRRYLDRSKVVSISDVREGENVTVIGAVKTVKKSVTAVKRRRILNVDIFDGKGYLTGVWFNQDYHADKLKVGAEVAFSGKVTFSYRRLQMVNPAYDVLRESDEPLQTARIVPMYAATSGLTSNMIRRLVKNVLDSGVVVPDALPDEIRRERKLATLNEAIREVHFPEDMGAATKARERLIYDELFFLELGLAVRKRRFETTEKGIAHTTGGRLAGEFLTSLPFRLTNSQNKALRQIEADMAEGKPMHRLLLGEVGSGKTVVAVCALLTTVDNGLQGAIMAPTEVLAEQHALKIGEMLPAGVRFELLKGSLAAAEKTRLHGEIAAGEVDIVVGTHALVQEGVGFKRLGLAVIDEQHRFGVRQRLGLREKGEMPDILVMTATPIPRTLAMTLYGDLDVSVIDELPAGRLKIETLVRDARHREDAYELIRQQIRLGHQAYVICPLVDESDKIQVKAATAEAERLRRDVFRDLSVGLLHGQLKPDEKDAVMRCFRGGETDILIATTVIEVGIDVPNVTVMLIEDAERFGLSQLHQLRGRIGRGPHKSFCVLFADPATEDAQARMAAIEAISDGFALAEEDLKIRGEGQLFGPRQSGLPDLKIASLARDASVLAKAREDAFKLVDTDTLLAKPEHKGLNDEVRGRFAEAADWLFSG